MEEKRTGMLEESPGVRSSKRVWGTVLLTGGSLLFAALGVFSFFKPVGDPQTAMQVGKTLLYTGAGLLGIGILEGIPGALGKKNHD